MPPKNKKPELLPFSDRLRAIIKKLDIEQKDLATVAEIHAATITAYLKTESQPAMLILSKWAQKYQINLNWLIIGEGPMFLDEQSKAAGDNLTPKTQTGQELLEIKLALQEAEASKEEIKQALLDYVSGGRAPLSTATGTDDDSGQ